MNGNILSHMIVMIVGTLILMSGAFIGLTDIGEKKLKIHGGLGVTGILVFLLGAIGLLFTGNIHTNLIHFYLGLITVIFFILTIIGGIAYTKANNSKKEGLRKSHKADAVIAFLLLSITVVFGVIGIKLLK